MLIDSVVDDVDIGDEEVKQRTILRAKKTLHSTTRPASAHQMNEDTYLECLNHLLTCWIML